MSSRVGSREGVQEAGRWEDAVLRGHGLEEGMVHARSPKFHSRRSDTTPHENSRSLLELSG